MARAVVPRTAAAVDHADTELIGHRGWEGTGFLCGGKRQHKNTDTNPCQTVLRASQNQAPTLSIQESPAAALNLSSGNAGSCCKGWYPCFCFVILLLTNLQNPFPRPWAPGHGGEKSEACIQGFMESYLSKLHSGRNIRDIHDRWESNPSMEFPDFLLHTFILHKHPFFTTSLENFALKLR